MRRVSARSIAAMAGAVVALLIGVLAAVYGVGGGTGGGAAVVTAAAGVQPSLTVSATTSPSATVKPSPKPSTKPSVKPSVKPTAAAKQRTVTFVNAVDQTIWVAGWQQTAKPALTTTGWVLPAGKSLTITVPDHWNGRFWGRTGCSFNAAGKGHCQTGDCGGVFQCRGYGGIPATLAEYNLNSFDNLDFYDVSMVDGANLPMYINITHGLTKDKISPTGCIAAGCTTAVDCPPAIQVMSGSTVIGCISACARLGTDQYCCRGAWAPRDKCDPSKWPIDYAAVFKKAEPYAYSYSDDDATSTFTCTGECGYRITFGLTP
jgi:hypothetical protein